MLWLNYRTLTSVSSQQELEILSYTYYKSVKSASSKVNQRPHNIRGIYAAALVLVSPFQHIRLARSIYRQKLRELWNFRARFATFSPNCSPEVSVNKSYFVEGDFPLRHGLRGLIVSILLALIERNFQVANNWDQTSGEKGFKENARFVWTFLL